MKEREERGDEKGEGEEGGGTRKTGGRDGWGDESHGMAGQHTRTHAHTHTRAGASSPSGFLRWERVAGGQEGDETIAWPASAKRQRAARSDRTAGSYAGPVRPDRTLPRRRAGADGGPDSDPEPRPAAARSRRVTGRRGRT